MNVVITGGNGFLGQKVARQILRDGLVDASSGASQAVRTVVLADAASGPKIDDSRVTTRVGDLRDEGFVRSVITDDTDSLFHLAAVVSGGAEADFDLGMDVNVRGMLSVLERARAVAKRVRMVFASSVAAYGGDMPDVVNDQTILSPQSSYGTQKVIGELLVGEYARKGYVDGRVVRLPTIVVRPGKPNRAASSFASGIIREPLQGVEVTCPVPTSMGLWILSPPRAVDALIHAHELPMAAWGLNRSVAIPGLTVTVGEMLLALEEVAGPVVANRVRVKRDPLVEKIVGSWPARFQPTRGLEMGFKADADPQSIIRTFIADELDGVFADS